MSRLSHGYSVEYAELYGVECAVLIGHFQFWIEQNQNLGRNFHDGRTWMYQTQHEIAAVYPYWNRDKIQAILQKLVDHKVIVKGNYNKTNFDKTTWYAFENEEMFTKVRNRSIARAESPNPPSEAAHTIPDTKPDTTQKQQQQQAAAVTAAASPYIRKKTTTQAYGCLADIDIPEPDKQEITSRHDETTVKNAIAWATSPQTVITRSLAAAIKWACSTQPEVPKSAEDEAASNKAYAMQYDGLKNEHRRVDVLAQSVEIVSNACYMAVSIKYDEKGFKEKLHKALKDNKFE